MTAKKRSRWKESALNLLLVLPSILNIATHFLASLEYDAYIAKKSLFTLTLLFLFTFILLICTWVCFNIIIFLVFIKWLSTFCALGLILAIHLILLLCMARQISKMKDGLTFPHTRELFH
jgi:hypothetical protein